MAVLDPSGFQMSVEVVSARDGTRYPLWMNTSVNGRQTNDVPDLPIVESIEITMSRGLTMGVSISIAAPFEQGIELLAGDLFVMGNTYEIRIGYPKLGRFLPWISCRAEKPELSINADEGLTATLTGSAGSFASLRGSSSRTYEGSYRDILGFIAVRGHNQWLTDFPDVESGHPFEVTRGQISQGNKSEWFFIQQIVRSANCDAYIIPSREEQGRPVLTVRRRSEAFEQDPRFTFVMKGRIDMETYFPLFSFDSPSEGVWVPRSQAGTTCTDINPDSGDTEEVTATVDTSDVPRTDEVAVGGDASARVGQEVVANHPSVSDDRETGERCVVSSRDPITPTEQARRVFEEGSTRGGIQATVSSFAIPELFPGDMVALANLGVFSGKYLIDSMSHHAAAGEWTMEMHLLNNAVSRSAVAEHLQVTPASINTRTAPDLADGSNDSTSGVGATEVSATEEGP